MQLEVELAGVNASWRFPGSLAFHTWLERRPWLDDGGLCVVRTPDCANGLIFDAIGRAAHAAHGDGVHFSVKRVTCGGAETPRQALMNHFDITKNLLDSRDDLQLALRDRRQLLVFTDDPASSIGDWEEFTALIEHLRKSALPLPLSIVVLDSRSQVIHEPVFQFIYGYTGLRVLDGAAGSDEHTVWSRYLHMRSWWDTGGSLAHAMDLSAHCMRIACGDDAALEAVLQSYAIEKLKSHPAASTLCAWLEKEQKPGGLGRMEAELLEAQFLWRPPGLQSLHVVPFAARAMLAERHLSAATIWRLRSELVCGPLMSEILSLCQFFETQIRTRLRGQEDMDRLSAETKERLRHYQEGKDRFTNYPKEHPSPPSTDQDALAFASLGELLNCCWPARVSDRDRSIQYLRNCLAHGHYVAWSHACHAFQALRFFDAAPRA